MEYNFFKVFPVCFGEIAKTITRTIVCSSQEKSLSVMFSMLLVEFDVREKASCYKYLISFDSAL